MIRQPEWREDVRIMEMPSSTSPLEDIGSNRVRARRKRQVGRQRCKSAPSGPEKVAELDAEAKQENAQIDRWNKYLTAAMFRLGLILVALREHFPTGWEAHLRELGIEETRWKRAKCLVGYFQSEDECRDFPMEVALRLAGWGVKQTQEKRKSDDGQTEGEQPDGSGRSGETNGDGEGPKQQTTVPKHGNADELAKRVSRTPPSLEIVTSDATSSGTEAEVVPCQERAERFWICVREAIGQDTTITEEERDALDTFVGTVGGKEPAFRVFAHWLKEMLGADLDESDAVLPPLQATEKRQ